METKKQRFKVSTKVSLNGAYYFSSFIYCKSLETINRTKSYKYYIKQLDKNLIKGVLFEPF